MAMALASQTLMTDEEKSFDSSNSFSENDHDHHAPIKPRKSAQDITTMRQQIAVASPSSTLSPLQPRDSQRPSVLRLKPENLLVAQNSASVPTTEEMFAEEKEIVEGVECIREKLETITGHFFMTKRQAHVSFAWDQFATEFWFQFFFTFSIPWMIYKYPRGWAEIHMMVFGSINNFWVVMNHIFCLLYFSLNFTYAFGTPDLKTSFFVPVIVMNFCYFMRVIVICVKYGYMPRVIRTYLLDPEKHLTHAQFTGYHLLSGWGKVFPYTIAKEIFYAQSRLAIDLRQLKLFFREKRAFNFENVTNCVCVPHYTTLDRLLPFLYLNSPIKDVSTVCVQRFVYTFTMFATMLPSLMRIRTPIFRHEFVWYFMAIFVGLVTYMNLWASILWALLMYGDMMGREQRSRWLTKVIDPNEKCWEDGLMNRTYKTALFAFNSLLSEEDIVTHKFQTIDMYSAETMFSWAMLRQFFRHVGLQFLRRIQNYLGIMLIWVTFLLSALITTLRTWPRSVIFEDCFFALLISMAILGPVMYTINDASFLNTQSEAQRVILSERVTQMLKEEQHADDLAEKFRKQEKERAANPHYLSASNMNETDSYTMEFWRDEVKKARETLEVCLSVLENDENPVNIFGVVIDFSIFQILGILFGLMIYFVGFFSYTEMRCMKKAQGDFFFYTQIWKTNGTICPPR